MSRQYTDSFDELCPLGGKRKFCVEKIPIPYYYYDSNGNGDTFACGYPFDEPNYKLYTKRFTSYAISEWTRSETTANVTKDVSSGRFESISCSGSVVSSCGASGSDVWYKRN